MASWFPSFANRSAADVGGELSYGGLPVQPSHRYQSFARNDGQTVRAMTGIGGKRVACIRGLVFSVPSPSFQVLIRASVAIALTVAACNICWFKAMGAK